MAFRKYAWSVAAYTSGLESKGVIATTMLNEPVVPCRKSDGSRVALEDRCVHRSIRYQSDGRETVVALEDPQDHSITVGRNSSAAQ